MRLRVARKVYKAWSYRHRTSTVWRAIKRLRPRPVKGAP